MQEHYYNDYNKAREMAKKWNMVEAEYGDTGYMYNDEAISYVCYNRSGQQNGCYNITCYYGWKRDNESGRLKPCKLPKELYNRVLSY